MKPEAPGNRGEIIGKKKEKRLIHSRVKQASFHCKAGSLCSLVRVLKGDGQRRVAPWHKVELVSVYGS